MGLWGKSCLISRIQADDQYQGILGAGSIILNICFLRETREDVLLSRRAKKLTKQTGQKHICASDLQHRSFFKTLKVSVVRPFGMLFIMRAESVTDPVVYLATEPIVTALAVWIGFAWSCLFLSAASTLLVFRQYGWNVGQLGSIQAYVSTTFNRSIKLISQMSMCRSDSRLRSELSSGTHLRQES
jgi:hypothetical protein